MVLCVHLFQHLLNADNPIIKVTRFGDRGVPVFFALSGFLIMYSIERSNILTFYLKRIFKIVPLYYFIITILVIFYEMPTDELGLGWMRYYLFMNEIVPAQHKEWISICGFWCMPSFMIFYMISPFIFKYTNSFVKIGLIVFASYLIGKILTSVLSPCYEINPVRSFINTMPIFFYGCWGYVAQKTNNLGSFLSISVIILIVFSSFNLSNYQVWGVATAAIIITSSRIQLPDKLRTNIIIKWFAKLSFTIFLVHYIVLMFLDSFILSIPIYAASFVLITVSLAYVLHITIERWSDKLLNKILILTNQR